MELDEFFMLMESHKEIVALQGKRGRASHDAEAPYSGEKEDHAVDMLRSHMALARDPGVFLFNLKFKLGCIC